MITGSAVALGGMVIEQTWNRGLSSYLLGLFPDWQWLQENMEVFH